MSAASRIAFDANILFYTMDHRDGMKRARCRLIIGHALHAKSGSLALQTVGEFASAIVRKGVLSKSDATLAAQDWLQAFETVAATKGAVDLALNWWNSDRLSYWDALLVATLSKGGITALVTEDMDARAVIGGVEIINPFDEAANAALDRHGMTI